MNRISSVHVKHLKDPQFWLLGVLAGITTIHLTLAWRADQVDLLGSSILFF